MFDIQDSDIAWAESLLLPDGASFNEERRSFIRCMESKDVIACPGSGKTTALLAKIAILSRKSWPSACQGMCVLTHTNVAIDEIRKKLKGTPEALFTYPHFFGTIQTFVDRFLAIPMYRSEFNSAPTSIDIDKYNSEIANDYYAQDYNLRSGWDKRCREDGLGDLQRLRLDPDSLLPVIPSQKKLTDPKSRMYQMVTTVRSAAFKRGYLTYSDAYMLAVRYRTKLNNLLTSFARRFAFVFIDEMQDTDEIQHKLIESLFDPISTVIQRLGDPNQAIYSTSGSVDSTNIWSPSADPLHFSDSLRCSQTTCEVLSTVRLNTQISLTSNSPHPDLSPHIIAFNKGEEELVIPAFASLLREYKLNQLENPIFKAIAWIGQDKRESGHLCLPSYFHAYRPRSSQKRRSFDNLISYVHHLENQRASNTIDAKELRDMILGGITRGIAIAKIRAPHSDVPFTPASFLKHLRDTDDSLYNILRVLLADWTIRLMSPAINYQEIRDEIADFVRSNWSGIENTKLTRFLDDNEIEHLVDSTKPVNRYNASDGIQIEVGTVHSVKGETHTATLYFDTTFHKNDAIRLLPFFLEYRDDLVKKERHKSTLKVAHVAFSRPTHLLAYATYRDLVDPIIDKLVERGWVIRSVESETAGHV